MKNTVLPKEADTTPKTKVKAARKTSEILPKLDPEEMISAFLHFGHRKTRTHSQMKPFVYTVRNNISIVDLEKTKEYFEKALMFLEGIIKKKGKILFVATRVPGKDMVGDFAKDLGMYWVRERWLGGTLTNFKTISSRLAHLKNLEKTKKSGEWEKYTKKERHDMDVELSKLNKKFAGIKEMEKLPDVVFILNLYHDGLAAKEARSRNISVVAICDTDANPRFADYPIPANDDAIQSVNYILDKVKIVIKNAQKK